jgi:hypothetical protein
MGGGTTIVEAIARGQSVVGNDLNSLATFVAKVKTTPLDSKEARAVSKWASRVVPNLNYRISRRCRNGFFRVGILQCKT